MEDMQDDRMQRSHIRGSRRTYMAFYTSLIGYEFNGLWIIIGYVRSMHNRQDGPGIYLG